MSSPFPSSVGSSVGLEIWRIENLNPVPIAKENFGCFHVGDAYLVLNTFEKSGQRRWDLHFWLGSECSQDEAGAAAWHTVQLDDQLGGKPVQHREVQGHEESLFLSYFPKGIQYLKGGVASGFRHVDRDSFSTRLFHLKGKRNVRVVEVEPVGSSLNDGDVFILDLGRTLYQWNGRQANKYEKFKGLEIITKIKDSERGGRAALKFVESGEEDDEFWQALGGKCQVKSAEEGGSDDATSQLPLRLFRVSDASGTLEMSEVASGVLKREMLDDSDCFLVDSGTAVFIWVGLNSTKQEKSSGLRYGQEYLSKEGRPSWTPLTRLIQHGETPAFKALFQGFDKEAMPAQEKAYVKPETKFMIDALYKKQSQVEEKLLAANGQLQIWRIQNLQLAEIEPQQYGHFYAGDSYVILYTYRQGTRDAHVTFFWQGSESSQDEKAASAFFAVDIDSKAPGSPCQVRIVQGKEPAHFLALFQGRFIVHAGGVASGFHNRAPGQQVDEPVRLYQVKGTTKLNTHAVAVAPMVASLNSGDSFVLVDSPNSYVTVWMGRGSNAEEREFAGAIAQVLANGYHVQPMDEGAENDYFWAALGGQTEYSQFKELDTAALEDPRFFQARGVTGNFVLEEVHNFTQDDLQQDSVCIIDAHSEVYIWLGQNCRREDKENAMKVAQEYVQKAPDGRSQDTPVMVVSAGSEPLAFISHFHGWSYEQASDFQDPYQAKLKAIQAQQPAAEPQRQVELKSTGGAKAPAAAASPARPVAAAPSPAKIPTASSSAPAPASAVSTSTTSGTFPHSVLSAGCPDGVDPRFKENHLSDDEFANLFKMSRADFAKLAQWKKDDLKKKVKLF